MREQLIREVEIIPIEVVVLTGYGSIATAVEAIKLGAVHYLTKPAEPEEILAAFSRKAASLIELPAETAAKPLDELEWEHLQRVLTDCKGNVSEAARLLGISRGSLRHRMEKWSVGM